MGKPKVQPSSSRRRNARRRAKGPRDGGKAPRTGMARDVGAVVLLALAATSGARLATFSSLDGALIAAG